MTIWLVFLGALGIYLNTNAQVNFTSSTLPIVVIDTDGIGIPDEPKIDALMGIIYNGPGQINHLNDPFNEFDGQIAIEKRGSSSARLRQLQRFTL